MFLGRVHHNLYISIENQPDAHLKFILFCNHTLHVLDSLSVHHQESETVHTTSGICLTGYVAAC